MVQTDEWNVWSLANTANIQRREFQNIAFVTHSRWFEGTLVSTLGWRRDWARNLGTPGVQFTPDGTINLDPSVFYLSENLKQRKDAFNYGLVLHAPKFIQRRLPWGADVGLTYNRSDNFTPGAYNTSVNGGLIPPEKGETKEYGFMVSLFERKIDLRVSHYRTASALSRNGTLQGGPDGCRAQLRQVRSWRWARGRGRCLDRICGAMLGAARVHTRPGARGLR